jgi:hypothetical protein
MPLSTSSWSMTTTTMMMVVVLMGMAAVMMTTTTITTTKSGRNKQSGGPQMLTAIKGRLQQLGCLQGVPFDRSEGLHGGLAEVLTNEDPAERIVISEHLTNIFALGDLDSGGNVQKTHIAGSVGPMALPTHDVTLSDGD